MVTWNGRALPRRQRTVGMYAWHASLDVPACDTPRSCATNSCTGLFHTHGACGAFHSFECAPNESSLSIALLHVFVLHAGDLLLGLGVDLGGDTIAILLALEGHLATTLGKLLNHTDLRTRGPRQLPVKLSGNVLSFFCGYSRAHCHLP